MSTYTVVEQHQQHDLFMSKPVQQETHRIELTLKKELRSTHRVTWASTGDAVVADVLWNESSECAVVLTCLNGILRVLCTAKSSIIYSRFNCSFIRKYIPVHSDSLRVLLQFKMFGAVKGFCIHIGDIVTNRAVRPHTPHWRLKA